MEGQVEGMIILGFDVETTGLDIHKNRIIEIATVRYDTTTKSYLDFHSCLLWDPSFENEEWLEAQKIHGISKEEARRHGYFARDGISSLIYKMNQADAICGHNVLNYDKLILEKEAARYEIDPPKSLWIDTSVDIPFGPEHSSKRLNHLLSDHGLHNPVKHRAVFDVYFTLELLNRYSLELVLKRSKSKTIKIFASVPREQNAVVRSRRFQWDPVNRYWHKTIKECDLSTEISFLGFEPGIISLP